MKKLIDGINKGRAPRDFTVDDWNAAVRVFFGPYFRRKSLLKSKRELLRTELLNLAKILPFPEYTDLLLRLLKTYRSVLRNHTNDSYNFLSLIFQDTIIADEKWMSLVIMHEPLSKEAPLTDRVYQKFDLLDAILEGSYKLHLRLLYGFALKYTGNQFPSNVRTLDFGAMVSTFPSTLASSCKLLLEDPEHLIKVNQWRNIAAHKNFIMKTSRTFEIEYGNQPRRIKRLTNASLERTLRWTILTLNTVRLCNLIIYVEHMHELKAAGLQVVPVRLESRLTGLCHNLGIVGFRCVSYYDRQSQFTLVLQNELDRPLKDAIIHASQVLAQLSTALNSALSHRVRINRAAVQLVDKNGNELATASVNIDDALAFTNKKIRMKKYISQIDFSFASSREELRTRG
ncbi:MAG: hypothetical protein QOG71_2511 [Pyrinomonadaceae bacterium]|nr:hypothetical protein [Pyrinomonadaceae bacterium]